VESALAQTMDDLEVVVIDDGSPQPVRLSPDPRVRVIRLPTSRGNAGARNAGLTAARGRCITCLDDDDVMLPHLAEVSLEALERSTLPPPVGVISGVAVLGPDGSVRDVRLPPTRPRGACFSLEPLEPGRSYLSKQTLVVETEVLRSVNGWDENLRSRTVTDLFLRLNPVCSLLGLDVVTYHLRAHTGPRLSRDPDLRQESFDRLIRKHRALLEAHPERYAELLLDHAELSSRDRDRRAALAAIGRALLRSPATGVRRRKDLARIARRSARRRRR
jgi:glycosyltransferase involved in cell wall biosynthesis